jgi:hypothetical protein
VKKKATHNITKVEHKEKKGEADKGWSLFLYPNIHACDFGYIIKVFDAWFFAVCHVFIISSSICLAFFAPKFF